MKTVSIFNHKDISSTVPNKVITYDDNGRIIKETERLTDGSNTSIAQYYEYDDDGNTTAMTFENYHNELKLDSTRYEYFDGFELVKKYVRKYFVNGKVDYVETCEYEIETTVITEENIDGIFETLSDPDDHEVYSHLLEGLKTSLLYDIIVKKVKPIHLKHLSEDDDDPEYYIVDECGNLLIDYCEGYVLLHASQETNDSFKTSSIEYFKSRCDMKEDKYTIFDIYDGLYLRKTHVDPWEDEVDYVETTYFYGFKEKGIYTKMDKNGAIIERLYYVYDGSELVATMNEKGETVESYHTEKDSQILNEYPVVNSTVTYYEENKA